MAFKNTDVLPDIKVGDILTAKMLTSITRAINKNTVAFNVPREKTDASTSGDGAGGGGLTNLTFTEDSRTITTETMTDSNGDTHDIDQIDQVVLSNSDGDVLTLNFTNP